MPQETSVELVKRLYDAVAEREFDRAFAGLDPEVEFDLSRRMIEPGIFRGHEGIRDLQRQQREVWSSERIEAEEYIPAGENVVVVPSRFVNTGRGSDISVSARAAYVWELRDGLVVRVTMYQSRAEALEAVE